MSQSILQEKSYYGEFDDELYKKYCSSQIKRHGAKSYKKRVEDEYLRCYENIKKLLCNNFKMLCLGTRNNYERDVFKEVSSKLNGRVYSQDIAQASKADFIGDFNKLSEIVPHDWDIIYSNSLDHAMNSKKAFFEWLKVLNKGGLMVLGFSFDANLSVSDCNLFTYDGVKDFMCDGSANEYTYIKSFKAVDYHYWVVQKLA